MAEEKSSEAPKKLQLSELQECPKCNLLIGALAGSQDAICKNCGYKDPCCE